MKRPLKYPIQRAFCGTFHELCSIDKSQLIIQICTIIIVTLAQQIYKINHSSKYKILINLVPNHYKFVFFSRTKEPRSASM